MNLIDAWVDSVNGIYYKYDKWWVQVGYTDMGGRGSTSLMFDTQEEAELVKVGYKFLH